MGPIVFRNRSHAGEVLAQALSGRAGGRADTLVLALPRGGVPVGFEVARALQAPLDVFVVRKLGVPNHEEYAMGAIASGGARLIDQQVVDGMAIEAAQIEAAVEREQAELARREQLFRGAAPRLEVAGRELIVVDDGLATGSTMRVAVRALRALHPRRIVVAVPTGSASACAALEREADELVCVSVPDSFVAVGNWYSEFDQTRDDEVCRLLRQAREQRGG